MDQIRITITYYFSGKTKVKDYTLQKTLVEDLEKWIKWADKQTQVKEDA